MLAPLHQDQAYHRFADSRALLGIPNFAITFGYTNASWTLKADLVSGFVCRVLNYMDDNGYDRVVPEHPGSSVGESTAAS